jgi:hypothetical protein
VKLILATLLTLGSAACTLIPDIGPSHARPTGSAPGADLEQYSILQMQLDQGRSQFLPSGATAIHATESKVYWVDFASSPMHGMGAPTAHSFDRPSAARVDYAFSVGDTTSMNFRASDSLVVTARPDTGEYMAYDAQQAGAELGQLGTVTPVSGARFWPYATDHDTLYVVAPDHGGRPSLYRWTAQAGTTMVMSISGEGHDLGLPSDVGVSGKVAALIVGGGLWLLDLDKQKMSPANVDAPVAGAIDVHADGVLFTTADKRLAFYDVSTSAEVVVSDAIAASSFKINDSFKTAHLYSGGEFARYGSWVVYAGNEGIFGFDMSAHTVKPILLSPAEGDKSVTYVHPAVTSDGTLYVQGLTGPSGSVATDGPVYSVDLSTVL